MISTKIIKFFVICLLSVSIRKFTPRAQIARVCGAVNLIESSFTPADMYALWTQASGMNERYSNYMMFVYKSNSFIHLNLLMLLGNFFYIGSFVW